MSRRRKRKRRQHHDAIPRRDPDFGDYQAWKRQKLHRFVQKNQGHQIRVFSATHHGVPFVSIQEWWRVPAPGKKWQPRAGKLITFGGAPFIRQIARNLIVGLLEAADDQDMLDLVEHLVRNPHQIRTRRRRVYGAKRRELELRREFGYDVDADLMKLVAEHTEEMKRLDAAVAEWEERHEKEGIKPDPNAPAPQFMGIWTRRKPRVPIPSWGDGTPSELDNENETLGKNLALLADKYNLTLNANDANTTDAKGNGKDDDNAEGNEGGQDVPRVARYRQVKSIRGEDRPVQNRPGSGNGQTSPDDEQRQKEQVRRWLNSEG